MFRDLNVLDRDQSAQLHRVIDNHTPLQPVPVHQRLGGLEVGAFGNGHGRSPLVIMLEAG